MIFGFPVNDLFCALEVLFYIDGEFATGLNIDIAPPLGTTFFGYYPFFALFRLRDINILFIVPVNVPVCCTQLCLNVLKVR